MISRHLLVAWMFNFSGKSALVIVLAALCLGGGMACAQTAPVRYWIPGWPIGFGGNWAVGRSANIYGDFPSFDFSDAGGGMSYSRANFSSGWFVGGEHGGVGLSPSGFSQVGAFGNFGSLSYDSVQFGYDFRNEHRLPLTVYAGFDTLTYKTGIGGPFAAFDLTSSTLPVYRARAGVAFQPAPNVSVSVEVGYTQQGRVESDGNALSLLGMSPSAFGGRP
jgi:opacity protein-like surface antigen